MMKRVDKTAIRKNFYSIILICILFHVAAAENTNSIISTDYEYLSDGRWGYGVHWEN